MGLQSPQTMMFPELEEWKQKDMKKYSLFPPLTITNSGVILNRQTTY